LFVWVCVCVCVCVWVLVCVCVCVCVYAVTRWYRPSELLCGNQRYGPLVRMNALISVYVRVCMYVYTHTCTYTHTHTGHRSYYAEVNPSLTGCVLAELLGETYTYMHATHARTHAHAHTRARTHNEQHTQHTHTNRLTD